MKRRYFDHLIEWKSRSNRKPLILRGARQVGKTHLIRDFAEHHFENFIEINFDETPEKAQFFLSTDLEKVLEYLTIDSGTPVVAGETLIFLDEIQKVPEIFAKLRYFYEKKPDLHMIAAGSLLDFVLAEHEFSMPVGRIEYLFMGPMDFSEFLLANGQKNLLSFIKSFSFQFQIPSPIHQKLQEQLRAYMAIGGMPAAVREYTQSNSLIQVDQELLSIVQTYRDDFSKYKKRIPASRLQMTLDRLPHLIGGKLKYVEVSREDRAKDIHETIQLLQMAKIIYCVHHSSGNALPLKINKNEKDFKPLFLDIGLMMKALNLKITDTLQQNILFSNRGALAEQFIGQQWLYKDIGQEPELYYWNREKRGAAAEVDYLFNIKNHIVPVEVKAGTTGSLKSIQVFAEEKSSPLGLRFNMDLPYQHDIDIKNKSAAVHRFRLISLPMYLISECERLCEFP